VVKNVTDQGNTEKEQPGDSVTQVLVPGHVVAHDDIMAHPPEEHKKHERLGDDALVSCPVMEKGTIQQVEPYPGDDKEVNSAEKNDHEMDIGHKANERKQQEEHFKDAMDDK
jgi:hypothetical protein